ncbi:MAG TPA: ATP-binding protein [Kribbellaceae bacterium]|jgi:two-component system sensor histidine kinase BaeS
MRRSLRFRLIGLSLLVALGAVAATAVLATYSTNAQLQGEYESSMSLLEADQAIYAELSAWANDHNGWQDVGPVVEAMAQRYGRRIALLAADGSVLADSAGGTGERPRLPSIPAATIDATGSAAGAPPYQTGVKGAFVSASTVTVGGFFMSPTWRLTDQERQRRERLAHQAVECLRAHNVRADLFPGPDGTPVVSLASTAKALETPGGLVVNVMAQGANDYGCIPAGLYAPSALAARVNQDAAARTAACLDRAGIGYRQVADANGLTAVVAAEDKTVDQRKVKECARTAQAEAMRPYVAPPAKLYLGMDDRFNVFSAEGMLRTSATALGVLLIAALVTVLAGRRLVRPILALTGAAQRMAAGDHAARVPVSGNDEVARLGHAFNAMASAVEANDHQRRVMVSDVAHELRTPLSNIKGYLEASEDGVVPLDGALVRSLQEEAALLERLVSDLQELALADAGMLRLHPEERDVAELAAQTVAAHRAAADADGVALELAAGDPAVAVVDPARIRQALGNLVANAVTFTPAGGVVRVSVLPRPAGVDIAVSDTGPGIGEEHLPYVFDRFYRADPSRSRATGGSGLGLAITKHLVEAHGGRVTVSSTAGKGSTFVITLPAG